MHKETFNTYLDELESNPKTGPRYVRNSGSLPFMYRSQLFYSQVIKIEYEILDAAENADVFRAAKSAMDCCIDISRMSDLKRTHDIEEFSQTLHWVAEWSADMHRIRRNREAAIRSREAIRKWPGPDKPIAVYGLGESVPLYGHVEKLSDMTANHAKPQAKIRYLAYYSVARWLPAMQNIIERIPIAERQAELIIAQDRLKGFLVALSKLSTMCKNPNDEHKRSQSGYGAVDAAYIRGVTLVGHAAHLARRMVSDGSDLGERADSIRRRVGTAWAQTREDLENLAGVSLFARTRLHRRDFAGVAKFARETGGMAPALEVLFHARGSKFTDY